MREAWTSNASTSDLARLVSFRTFSAWSRSFQNSGSAACSSSSTTRLRLASTSKMPPELVRLLAQPLEGVAKSLDVEIVDSHE